MRGSRSAPQLAASLAISAEGTNVHSDPLLKVSCSLLLHPIGSEHTVGVVGEGVPTFILFSCFLEQTRFLSCCSFGVVLFIRAK